MKEYKDIKGQILSDGDRVVTIGLNGKAVGGDLVEAIFRLNEKGVGRLENTPENRNQYLRFYKQNFESKVLKIN